MSRTILVADDNDAGRKLLISALGDEYDVIEAAGGEAAIAAMRRHCDVLSAVLLDAVMPHVDGYDVLTAARADAMLSRIPVIIITEPEDEGAGARALELGADDYIVKPADTDIVRHCLNRSIALREINMQTCDSPCIPENNSSEQCILPDGAYQDDRELREQQRFLINNIPGGVAVFSASRSDKHNIHLTWFSDGFCGLFGYTREEYGALIHTEPAKLIFDEYAAGFTKQLDALIHDGTPIDYMYRAHSRRGAIWIHIKAVRGECRGDSITMYAVMLDVTQQQEALERLRVSEEENRLALRHSSNVVCKYDVERKTLRLPDNIDDMYGVSGLMTDVPDGEIKKGNVSPETVEDYKAFYGRICSGEADTGVTYQRMSNAGWRWVRANSSTIFASDGKPVSAVISFADITESVEKDIAYQKWMQSLHNKAPESYTLYRCNLSRKTVFDTVEGELLYVLFKPGPFNFDEHTEEYVSKCVHPEDRARFIAFLDVDALLESYYRGKRTITLEYREMLPGGGLRWLRLTADLVEYPHSKDVEVYLLFEDIDEMKRSELLTIERAERDPLTGVYNRATFAEHADTLIREERPGARHALLMLDIDGFKLVNDVFGHNAGDQTLIEVAGLLRTLLRKDDLVGRLGGDEFLVFLNDIPEERIAANKARQICGLCRKSYNPQVRISGSVGIAVCPHDGTNFDTLYRKADKALYHVKNSGKDDFCFYQDDMKNESIVQRPVVQSAKPLQVKKRRMLIVDDNKIDCEMLANIFKGEFIIEKARDGHNALIRLRHYGTAISVVLLDLMMPGMDGFDVLGIMQQSAEMQSIPVVVVSGADDRATSLKAIRSGASDFVMKPVDPDVLRIRVQSAISKAENEALRAKNSFLELQNAEIMRYRTVIEKLGLAVAEMDWGKSTFIYGPSMPRHIAGRYDGRTLWHILLTDLVADAEAVRELQQLVYGIADDRKRSEGNIAMLLKTPSGSQHRFNVSIYKITNEFGLTDRMMMTFADEEVN